MIERGAICWFDFGTPAGSRPAKRRPVVVVQADAFNRSALRTVLVAAVTSNTALAAMPGNVFLPAVVSGLDRDSVVNVTTVTAVDRDDLDGPVGTVPPALMREVDAGLRQVLAL